MAQTWPVSRKRLALLRLIDFIGRGLAAPLRRSGSWVTAPYRILVIEPWNVGDVVLSTSVLADLRSRFPRARISLLAKPFAKEILEGSALVDEIIPFDFPWTAQRNKYAVGAADLRRIVALVKRLRAEQFDVTIDSRMDIRSNLIAAFTGARHRVGYDIGGGGWLLTDMLPSDREKSHKIDDWLALVDLLPAETNAHSTRPLPKLTVTEDERRLAREKVKSLGLVNRPLIGYHPGGSYPGKRWPRAHFEELITELNNTVGGSHVVFLGPVEQVLEPFRDAVTIRPSLRELMALLTCCDVLVCNDSGPMHIADALGVALVAIFEVGNPQWFGPSGEHASVAAGKLAGIGLSAAPLDKPPADPVSVTYVAEVVRNTLRARATA